MKLLTALKHEVPAQAPFPLLSGTHLHPYAEGMEKITCLGETNFRNQHKRFGIKHADRRHHVYVIGRTGTGKSTLIANMCQSDLHGHGLALLDPHGDLVEEVLRRVPEERKSDLIYFDATDPACSIALNPLEVPQPGTKPLVASGLISVFKKIWSESRGPRMEYILRNVFLALLDQPGSTLLDVPRLLDDRDFRSYVVARVGNAEVRRFWLQEYQKFPANFRAEAISPIQNKIGEFLLNPMTPKPLNGHAPVLVWGATSMNSRDLGLILTRFNNQSEYPHCPRGQSRRSGAKGFVQQEERVTVMEHT